MLTDVGMVDAHQHLWVMDRDYPWLHEQPAPHRLTGDDRSIRVDYRPIDIFGVARTMFASNVPVDRAYSGLRRVYGAYDEITRGSSPHERPALFGGTDRQVYRIVDADSSMPPPPSLAENDPEQ